MIDPRLVLYHFPDACSQVSVCALNQSGLAYTLELVNLAANAQSSETFLKLSPMGKVPTLLIDSDPLTENAAVLTFIAALRPDAGLFPSDPSPRMRADIVGGLAFCGGTLHPQIRGLANPSRLTTGDVAPVREKSADLAKKSFGYAEHRLEERGWWLGVESIIDVYLNWAVSVARKSGFEMAAYPSLDGLVNRLNERPAFAQMIEGEVAARKALGL